MYLELHMLQNFAPSNLNRDDTNNPKDCEFGGHRRARISSQCLKRAIRREPLFAKTTGVEIATRTKWLTRLLSEPLLAADKPAEEVTAIVEAFVTEHISKLDKKKKDSDEEKKQVKTAVLTYMSAAEVNEMAATLLENWDTILPTGQPVDDQKAKPSPVLKKLSNELIKKTRNGTSAPDIALFGRMLAEQPELNLEAACQVAHAISTHRVTMEMDFFTAVDDLQPEAETGAGMMGFTGFDSACFYRYARLDWEQLVKNLRGETDLARRTVEGFIRAAIAAVPSGKQNSTAAHNPPNFILAVVREDGMGWSLVNAFEKPVRPRVDSGLVEPSLERLDTYWGRLVDIYGADSIRVAAVLSLDPDLSLNRLQAYRLETLTGLVNQVLAALPQQEVLA